MHVSCASTNSEHTFAQLVRDIDLPYIDNGLPGEKIIAIVMYRLATGCTMREISNLFAVSESSVHKYTKIVVNRIIHRLSSHVGFPMNEADRRRVTGTFVQYGLVYGD